MAFYVEADWPADNVKHFDVEVWIHHTPYARDEADLWEIDEGDDVVNQGFKAAKAYVQAEAKRRRLAFQFHKQSHHGDFSRVTYIVYASDYLGLYGL